MKRRDPVSTIVLSLASCGVFVLAVAAVYAKRERLSLERKLWDADVAHLRCVENLADVTAQRDACNMQLAFPRRTSDLGEPLLRAAFDECAGVADSRCVAWDRDVDGDVDDDDWKHLERLLSH